MSEISSKTKKYSVLPFGPQHPVLPEPVHLKFLIDEEKIVDVLPNLGYVHRGIERGCHNWIMAYVHIAHDCVVGDHTIFANNASLAGHAEVGDWAILGGFTAVHQFCKVPAPT